ncbi:MAG: pyridoxal-phosphate dependent enzyme [bacterium]|nr:pyridoxal-phosphate dependent enzyme [bacterium]
MTHAPLHSVTPLWRSDPLSRLLGEPVWLKMDCFQPVASFKLRGMGRLCSIEAQNGARRVYTSSGGNAGYAIAYACRELKLSATVVVPRTTSEMMRERIRDLGADVVEHGDSWDDAHEHALGLSEDDAAAYVHPFDHPVIWDGHASVIEEAAKQGPRPGVVVASVGGGGLLCGILEGMHRVGWADVPVVAVETEGAASFKAAADAGEPVTLPEIRSLAITLGARRIAPKLLEWKQRHEIRHWLATDRQAVDGCKRFLDDHRVLVEPSCGAALAALYERVDLVRGRGPVLVEVCGGAGASLELLRQWDARA